MMLVKSRMHIVLIGVFAISLISGCKESGRENQPSTDSEARMVDGAQVDVIETKTTTQTQDFFNNAVQPHLDFCRTCHIPGGVADIGTAQPEYQNRFLLSGNVDLDYDNLNKAWTDMGMGVESNPLLKKPSDIAEAHSGGQPWPLTSNPYVSMQQLLTCWSDATRCEFGVVESETPANANSLLGSRHARSLIDEFCDGQPDDAVVPQDPRSLVQPGVNEGRAVAFNAYWQDCTGPGNNPIQRAQTCGEYRNRVEEGRALIQTKLSFHVNKSFATAGRYYNLWKRWGLSERPDNFDEMVRARYGLPVAPFNNPYPLPGEDPEQTGGGSGQLPLGLTQILDKEGGYTGNISISCQICHGGDIAALGEAGAPSSVPGLGSYTLDVQLLITDLVIPLPAGVNMSPGVTNAMGLSGLLISFLDPDSMGMYWGNIIPMQFPGNTRGGGDTKMPPLWNTSQRPRKFWDGGLSADAARLDSAILNLADTMAKPLGNDKSHNKAVRDKVEIDSIKVQAYVDSITAPQYPFTIDEAMAEQGAVLFHSKDLWANGANADIPRPPTNGSCAGCHGAYSPRYVNDPAFLEDPRLEGIAGYIAPLDQIRTDGERSKSFTKPLTEAFSTSWLAYPEGSPGYQSPDDKTTKEELRDNNIFRSGKRVAGACNWQGYYPEDVRGYLAPPLYGIWATAPYLHNGSVPDLWTLLTPAERPAVWRRKLTEKLDNESHYDTQSSAYDQDRLGWKYDTLICDGSPGEVPLSNCEPVNPKPGAIARQNFWQFLGTLDTLGYQVRQPISRKNIERRKIFSTHDYAKSNTGHDFTRSLGEGEKRAIIEYLKTL